MPNLKDTRELPYAVSKVFALALDVDKYPEFLPYVKALRILSKQPGRISARVKFGLGPLGFSYDCEIIYVTDKSIRITCRDRLFKSFEAFCSFESPGRGQTRIAYELEARFASRVVEALSEGLLRHWTRRTIVLFERRLRG